MKRRLAILLVLALCAMLLPVQAAAAQTSYTSSTGITINVDMSPLKFDADSGIYYVGDRVLKTIVSDNQGNIMGYRLLDFSGNVLCELSDDEYYSLDYFHEGLAWVERYDEWTGESGWGCINKYGELVVPAIYSQRMGDFSDGLAKVMKNGYYGYIDKTGKEVIPCVYSEATDFNGGYAAGTRWEAGPDSSDGVTEIIDTSGRAVWTSPTTSRDTTGMGTIHDIPDYRLVSYNNVVGGKVLMYRSNSDGTSKFVLVGVDGSMRELPNLKVEGDYPPIYQGDDLFSSLKGVYWCVKHGDGTVIYPYVSYISGAECDFSYGVSMVYVDNQDGVIDKNGQYVIPLGEFVLLNSFEDGTALARSSNSWPWSYYFLTIEGASQPSEPEPEPETPPASDEPSGWAAEDVQRAVESGIVPESLQSAYTQATTRAEFCALAVELYESVMGEEITERATFTDTDDINVQKMAGLGVVNGMGEGKFEPNSALTREQAATLLSRLAAAMDKPFEASAPTFADNGSVSDWASAAVGEMQLSGVMGGVGEGMFDPKGSYTREQSIITMLRTLDIVG